MEIYIKIAQQIKLLIDYTILMLCYHCFNDTIISLLTLHTLSKLNIVYIIKDFFDKSRIIENDVALIHWKETPTTILF